MPLPAPPGPLRALMLAEDSDSLDDTNIDSLSSRHQSCGPVIGLNEHVSSTTTTTNNSQSQELQITRSVEPQGSVLAVPMGSNSTQQTLNTIDPLTISHDLVHFVLVMPLEHLSCAVWLYTDRYVYAMACSDEQDMDRFLERYRLDLSTMLVVPPILLAAIFALPQDIAGPAATFLSVSCVCEVLSVIHIFASLLFIRMIPRTSRISSLPFGRRNAWDWKAFALPVAWLLWGFVLFTIGVLLLLWGHDLTPPRSGDVFSSRKGAITIVMSCGFISFFSAVLTWRKFTRSRELQAGL